MPLPCPRRLSVSGFDHHLGFMVDLIKVYDLRRYWLSRRRMLSGMVVLFLILMAIFSLGFLRGADHTPLSGEIVTPTATPTSVPVTVMPEATSVILNEEESVLLLHETFADPALSSLNTGMNDYASFAFVDETYRITVHEPDAFVWSPCEGIFGDVTIATELIFTTGSGDTAAGLLFRFQDEYNFYFFNISANGYYALDLFQNGRWVSLVDWTRTTQVRPSGEANQLRVEVVEDYIHLYINDMLLDVVSDDTFAEGNVAFAVNTFEEQDISVFFDNLIIWRDTP
ncbi:MAG: hypothetical protein AAGF95_04660 [Chloroflexota bacterium]